MMTLSSQNTVLCSAWSRISKMCNHYYSASCSQIILRLSHFFLSFSFNLYFIFNYHLVTLYSPLPAITTLLPMSMSPFAFMLNPFTL